MPRRQPVRRRWLLLVAVVWGAAAGSVLAQDEFNILANDDDHQFKPKIIFSEVNGDRIRVSRDGGDLSYEVVANPGRISGCVVGNLVQFPFTEIAEDMTVGVTIGGFSFEAALGDDNSRRVNRDGELLPFDVNKKSAIYYFEMEVPPTTDTGESRFRRVGYVKFAWTTKTVTATVLVNNVDGTGVERVYDRQSLVDLAGLDPDRGGARLFKNEAVDVSLTFGSATGVRTVFGGGKVQTIYRRVGSEARGNSDILQLDSLVVAGGADLAAPDLVAKVPAVDQDADHLIGFNGTLTDLAPSSLSGTPFPVSLHLFVDGFEMVSDGDFPDYNIDITEPDSKGKCIFTITNLILPDLSGSHSVVVQAVDVSGNVRKTETQVAESGLRN